MTEIKVYWCGTCKKKGMDFRSTRKDIRKHLREIHGIKGISIKDDNRGATSSLTMSGVMK